MRVLGRVQALASVWARRRGNLRAHSGTTNASLETADAYCLNLVKAHDFDNYLAGLLVPKQYRAAYFAIRAYNVEIATIKDQMGGNALAGRVRFQWWRDLIDEMYSGKAAPAQQQPTALALSHYVKRHSLSRRWLDRSLDARQRDASQSQPESLDDLENYAEHGHSSILYSLLESMDIRDEEANFMASHVGVASGLTTLLRGFPHHTSKVCTCISLPPSLFSPCAHLRGSLSPNFPNPRPLLSHRGPVAPASQRQVYLPAETMRKHALTAGQVLSAPPQHTAEVRAALQNCVFDVASQAHGHLDRARELFSEKKLPRAALNVCAPAVRSSMMLESLRQAHFNPYDESLHTNTQLRFQFRLLWMRLSGTLA